ncbi:MAG: 4-hydroxybenzoate octaprenyltransferase [bacterium]
MSTVDAQQPSIFQVARMVASDIKIAHSVFALPFALLAAIRAFDSSATMRMNSRQGAIVIGLIVVCMVLARTWAMLFNRLVDSRIDRENARTARRIFASGALSSTTGWIIALLCAGAFAGVAALFNVLFDNHWPLALSLPVLLWIAFYSITKRFTMLCHVFLGGALAASPIAAAIAVDPETLATDLSLWALSAFVLFWVAGFNVLYALQDERFDRERGLHSIPSKFGTAKALTLSRAMHVLAFSSLVAAYTTGEGFGGLFAIGVGVTGALLILEHAIVAQGWKGGKGVAALNMAFFTVNGVVSCILGALGVVDTLW